MQQVQTDIFKVDFISGVEGDNVAGIDTRQIYLQLTLYLELREIMLQVWTLDRYIYS